MSNGDDYHCKKQWDIRREASEQLLKTPTTRKTFESRTGRSDDDDDGAATKSPATTAKSPPHLSEKITSSHGSFSSSLSLSLSLFGCVGKNERKSQGGTHRTGKKSRRRFRKWTVQVGPTEQPRNGPCINQAQKQNAQPRKKTKSSTHTQRSTNHKEIRTAKKTTDLET